MEVNKLPVESAAALGYNYEVVITHEDLTAAGTTQTLTATIPANHYVKGGLHVLDTEFTDGGATIGTVSYTVGDGSDADLYLTSTQVESSGAVVSYKAPINGPQLAANMTSSTTAAEVALAFAAQNGKVYTSADTLDFAFTANADQLANLNAGKLRFFFSMVDLTSLNN